MSDQNEQVKSISKMLQEGLDEVFSSEHFRRFLTFIANNPNYSYRNVILILQQCPHARRVMGFKAWLKEGRIVRKDERGLRINALFDKRDEDDGAPRPPSNRNRQNRNKKNKQKDKFRRISVFDISQTVELDADDDAETPKARPVYLAPVTDLFEVELLEGDVAGYGELLDCLNAISPLPILFRSGVKCDGMCGYADITIRKDMSQLHTIRTIVNQITHCWRFAYCPDKKQLEIECESVAFIVCQYLGLDTSEFSFHHIAKYALGKERGSLELFLDAIQKTALFLIDSIDGERTARKTSYDNGDFSLLVNPKTAMRLFKQGHPVYLVFLGEGELLTTNNKDIEAHEGPFAIERMVWFDTERLAA